MKKIAVVYLVLSLLTVTAFGQVDTGLLKSLTAIAGMRERLPVEKLYLQLDKPYYAIGDTLRFKAYLLNSDFLKPSARSGLLYVELDNGENKAVKQIMIPIISGYGWGDIALNENDTPQGGYILRAYTNWMRNFGEDYIFKKDIYISPVSGSATLVKAGFKLEKEADKDKITAGLLFTGLNGDPKRLKDLQFRIKAGNKTLFKDRVNTNMDGIVKLNFGLVGNTSGKNLYIQAQDMIKGADTDVLTIPITLNRPENTDIQFMPEGGNMVAGIPIKIGFKAIGEDGKSTTISGKIVNSHQQELIKIRSEHAGMGSFELTPQAGENYSAIINLPNGSTKTYALPAVKSSGTVLQVKPVGKETLEVTLSATPDMPAANYYLVAQTRGLVCYTKLIKFNGKQTKIIVANNLFSAGIAHFTLLNTTQQPLNERIVYIDHNDNLQLSLSADKPKYDTRDSVVVAITVKDGSGKPARGTFSLAVTDDSQVRTDSIENNIISDLLLTSDLKGTVEEPGWYFINNASERATALDNLLLTQGWIGYDWKQIFATQPKQPKYPAEKEFVIKGTVTNVFNKPLKNTAVNLLQREPVLAMETKTDNDGHFLFKGPNLYPSDTAFYMIQTARSTNVGINVDEFISPVFALLKERPAPWYVNTDTMLLKNSNTKLSQQQAEANYRGEGHMLKEVDIKATRRIADSQNPYPYADITLDEKDMTAAKKLSLFEFFRQKYGKDFYVTRFPGTAIPLYILNTRAVILIIDGRRSFPPATYMDYLSAEDIKGIEVVYKITGWIYDFALCYITTYSGHGPLLKHTPGRYAYKPLPFSFPKEFYRPRYTVKNSGIALGTDLRSTIHWAPNVITDKDGKATVSCFTADKPGDYTIIMEGTDLNGNIGYTRQKIKVNASK